MPQPHNVEVVGEQEGQHHQGHRQPDDFIPAFQHQGKVAHQPGRESLGHLVLVGQIVGDAADDVAEHDAHQRDHHHILELDALDEPDENPGAQNRCGKGKDGPAPQGGGRHEQQRQQDAQLGRGDGSAGGGRNKLVAAQLLHDEAGYAHPDAGAQNGQQAGQARDDEDLHLLKIACQNLAWRQINDSDEQRTARQSKQQYKQKNGGSILFDKKRSLLS